MSKWSSYPEQQKLHEGFGDFLRGLAGKKQDNLVDKSVSGRGRNDLQQITTMYNDMLKQPSIQRFLQDYEELLRALVTDKKIPGLRHITPQFAEKEIRELQTIVNSALNAENREELLRIVGNGQNDFGELSNVYALDMKNNQMQAIMRRLILKSIAKEEDNKESPTPAPSPSPSPEPAKPSEETVKQKIDSLAKEIAQRLRKDEDFTNGLIAALEEDLLEHLFQEQEEDILSSTRQFLSSSGLNDRQQQQILNVIAKYFKSVIGDYKPPAPSSTPEPEKPSPKPEKSTLDKITSSLEKLKNASDLNDEQINQVKAALIKDLRSHLLKEQPVDALKNLRAVINTLFSDDQESISTIMKFFADTFKDEIGEYNFTPGTETGEKPTNIDKEINKDAKKPFQPDNKGVGADKKGKTFNNEPEPDPKPSDDKERRALPVNGNQDEKTDEKPEPDPKPSDDKEQRGLPDNQTQENPQPDSITYTMKNPLTLSIPDIQSELEQVEGATDTSKNKRYIKTVGDYFNEEAKRADFPVKITTQRTAQQKEINEKISYSKANAFGRTDNEAIHPYYILTAIKNLVQKEIDKNPNAFGKNFELSNYLSDESAQTPDSPETGEDKKTIPSNDKEQWALPDNGTKEKESEKKPLSLTDKGSTPEFPGHSNPASKQKQDSEPESTKKPLALTDKGEQSRLALPDNGVQDKQNIISFNQLRKGFNDSGIEQSNIDNILKALSFDLGKKGIKTDLNEGKRNKVDLRRTLKIIGSLPEDQQEFAKSIITDFLKNKRLSPASPEQQKFFNLKAKSKEPIIPAGNSDSSDNVSVNSLNDWLQNRKDFYKASKVFVRKHLNNAGVNAFNKLNINTLKEQEEQSQWEQKFVQIQNLLTKGNYEKASELLLGELDKWTDLVKKSWKKSNAIQNTRQRKESFPGLARKLKIWNKAYSVGLKIVEKSLQENKKQNLQEQRLKVKWELLAGIK